MSHQNVRSSDLIGSDRVEGTSVYGREGNKIGTVRRILIDKVSGQARDVEISVGAFLGMGGELHRLPWQKLEYDTELGGYRLEVTEEQLKKAPTHSASDSDKDIDRAYQSRVYSYWLVTPYW